MSATITWIIDSLLCKPQEGSYTDVVVTAEWHCFGTQTANDVDYTAINYGNTVFPMPEGVFTPYDQLTQDQVLGWCWANGADKPAVEANIQLQIDNKINPPIVTPPLPWVTAPTEGA